MLKIIEKASRFDSVLYALPERIAECLDALPVFIKNSTRIENCEYLSLIFVANSKLLDKNYSEVNSSMELLLEKLLND